MKKLKIILIATALLLGSPNLFAQHDHSAHEMATENQDQPTPDSEVMDGSEQMMQHDTMMNHEQMDSTSHQDMNHDAMESMNHDEMNPHDAHGTDAHKTVTHDAHSQQHSSHDHSPREKDEMNSISSAGAKTSAHSNMDMSSMQGGSAPADARDPHGYSGGYTLANGPYVLVEGERQLHLADEHNFWSVNLNRLEVIDTDDGNVTAIEGQAWYGRNYDKFVIKIEGEIVDGDVEEIQNDLLWSHAFNSFWDVQSGIRLDGGEGPNRNWLAVGVQGLAPYWFEMDSTFYVGESGRTALQFEAEYELLITQKLVLQPRAEMNFYGKDDLELGIGSGLSSASIGLRLRYEFSRQFAPYVGVEWNGTFGNTADFVEAEGKDTRETQWLAGVKFWF